MRQSVAIVVYLLVVVITLGSTSVWALTAELEAKLLAHDGELGDGFGWDVAIDGDTAIIGAAGDNDYGENSGSVYVFTRTAGAWTEQVKLVPTDGAQGDEFGYSVAIDGDTAVISSVKDNHNGTLSGSAYVFTYAAGMWTEQAKLVPADAAALDRFGRSVALDGDTAVISAYEDDDNGANSGSAYVFTRTGDVWTQQAKLLPADGAAEDYFGGSVALDGDTAVIGANRDDDNGEDSGSAYVFTRIAGVWTQQAKLLASDGAAEWQFGTRVALDGDAALIGAIGERANMLMYGSAYVFTRTAGIWTEQAKLLASDGGGWDQFGSAVALDGHTAVIGANRDDDNGDDWGSAYVFTYTGGVWTEQAKLLPTDGADEAYFGGSAALDGDTAVIGALGDDDNGHNSGSAYVFRLYDDDVPATSGIGLVLLLLAALGTGAYFMRRRAASCGS